MKRLLLIMLAAAFILSGCAKEATNAPEKASPEAEQTQNSASSKGEEKAEKKTETKESDNAASEIADIEKTIDEFNTTKDEERKEELRIQLEEFFKQAEEQTITITK